MKHLPCLLFYKVQTFLVWNPTLEKQKSFSVPCSASRYLQQHCCVSPHTLVWLKHSFISRWVKHPLFSRVKGTHTSIAKEENCATASKHLTCFYKAHLYYNSICLHLSFSSIIVSFHNLLQRSLAWCKGYCTCKADYWCQFGCISV